MEQLRKARRLIEEQRTAEAKRLLRTIDHPTARKWLAELGEKPAAPRRGGGGGFVVALVLVFLLLVLGGGAALIATGTVPLNLPGLPIAGQLPTDTAGPSPTPTVTPTLEPCEPQDWWDDNDGLIVDMFNPDLAGRWFDTRGELNNAVDTLKTGIERYAQVTYPSCLAPLYSALRDAADARLLALDSDVLRTALGSDPFAVTPDAYRAQAPALVAALDRMAAVIRQLRALGINWRSLENLLADDFWDTYVLADLQACPYALWGWENVAPFTDVLLPQAAALLNSDPPDSTQLEAMVRALQLEYTRLNTSTPPDCVAAEHQLLKDTINELLGIMQGVFLGDRDWTRQNLADFERKTDELQNALDNLLIPVTATTTPAP